VLLYHDCKSAADGLNAGLKKAKNEMVVCVHQDVYLPEGWVSWFWHQHDLARRSFGEIGVLGVFGASHDGSRTPKRSGHVVDRDRLLAQGKLPASVETLDELLLAVPADTPLRFDPALGFHFYGADLCLTARQQGLAAVAIDAICFHNSLSVDVPAAFYQSGAVFSRKWKERLPVATACVAIDRESRMSC
jgi:hypothetical protein